MPRNAKIVKKTTTTTSKPVVDPNRQLVKQEVRAALSKVRPMKIKPNKPKPGKKGTKPRARNGKAQREAAAISSVLEALTLPRESQPIGLGQAGYGSDPTGKCNPFHRIPLDFNTLTAGNNFDNTNLCVVFRSGARFAVIGYPTDATNVYTYSGTDVMPLVPGGDSETFNPGALAAVGVNAPHGDYLFPGRLGQSDEHRGFWLDRGATVNVVMDTVIPAAHTFNVQIKRQQGKEWVVDAENQLSTGVQSFTYTHNASSGYMSYSVAWTGAPAATVSSFWAMTITHTWTNIGYCYAHLALPNFAQQFGSIDAFRIIGVSAMFTNTTAAVSRNGQVVGLQADAGTDWRNYQLFESLSEAKKAVSMESSQGLYGFLKPAGKQSFELLREFTTATTTTGSNDELEAFPDISDIAFDILPNEPYLLIGFSADKSLTGTSGYWTLCAGVEFTSNDQWRSLNMACVSPEDLDNACQFLSAVPQWHKNDFHISDLWKTIKGVASDVLDGILNYGPKLISAASVIAPLML